MKIEIKTVVFTKTFINPFSSMYSYHSKIQN